MYYATNQKHDIFAFSTKSGRNSFVAECATLDTWAISREKALSAMKSYITCSAAKLPIDQFRAVYDFTLTATEPQIIATYNMLRG